MKIRWCILTIAVYQIFNIMYNCITHHSYGDDNKTQYIFFFFMTITILFYRCTIWKLCHFKTVKWLKTVHIISRENIIYDETNDISQM
jgi:hypothetical protein